MEQYEKIQQLLKKEPGTKERVPIFPPTVIQAVFDAKTGASLEAILAQFNSITVQYQGSPRDTRLAIPMEMRRPGLTITYTTVEGDTLTERANSQVTQDDNWALDTNWSRIDELSLSGDIAVSARGTWIINGEDTGIKAVGPKGENGITPWLKEIDNKLHYSYDNVKWTPCSDPLSAQFRNHNNRIQISYDKGKTWKDISDPVATYVRFAATSSTGQDGSIGKLQYSYDKATWHDLSPEFRNYLRIHGYVATVDKLPAGVPVGTIYGVGPTYKVDDITNSNPMYQIFVWNGTDWVNNGYFTSLSAGIVQETGNSETEVMSQKAVTEKLSELGQEVNKNIYGLKILQAKNKTIIAGGQYLSEANGKEGQSYIVKKKSNGVLYIDCRSAQYNGVFVVGSVSEGESLFVFKAPQDFTYMSAYSKDGDVVEYLEVYEAEGLLEHIETNLTKLNDASIVCREKTSITLKTTGLKSIYSGVVKKGDILNVRVYNGGAKSNVYFTTKIKGDLVSEDFKVIEIKQSEIIEFSYIADANFDEITAYLSGGSYCNISISILSINYVQSLGLDDYDKVEQSILPISNRLSSVYDIEASRVRTVITGNFSSGKLFKIKVHYTSSADNGTVAFSIKRGGSVILENFKIVEQLGVEEDFEFTYVSNAEFDEITIWSKNACNVSTLIVWYDFSDYFVMKEGNKVLSDNNFTDEYKEKLDRLNETSNDEIESLVERAENASDNAERINAEMKQAINELSSNGTDATLAALSANSLYIDYKINQSFEITESVTGNYNVSSFSAIFEPGYTYKVYLKTNVAIGQADGTITIGEEVYSLGRTDLSEGIEFEYIPKDVTLAKALLWLWGNPLPIATIEIRIYRTMSVKDISLNNLEYIGNKYYSNPVLDAQSADPTIVDGGDGYYYMYHTGKFENTMYRSSNLIQWEDTGECPFNELTISQLNTLADYYGSDRDLYAPTIVKNGDYFLMYVSVTYKCMVVLRSRTPYGYYEFVGEPKALIDNTITGLDITNEDSCVARDLDGQIYLMWGSHGKMYRTKLTDDGLNLVDGATFEHVAGDGSTEETSRKIFEGLYAYRRNGYWYLFAAKGNYTSSIDPYEVVVGRCKTLSGVFVDKQGRKMTDGYAELILEPDSVNTYLGGGHTGEIFVDKNNKTYMFYQRQKAGQLHYRPLFLQEILWGDDGWPYFKDGVTQMVDVRPKL